MVIDSVNPSLITIGGTALIGFLMGFALRKIIKWAVMILGVLVGVIFIAIQYLHVHGYIADVDWNRLGTHLAAHVQTLAAQIDLTNAHGVMGELGLPLTGGAVQSGIIFAQPLQLTH